MESKKSQAEFLRWMCPVIKALRDLGGSAKPDDCCAQIIKNEKLTDEEVNSTRGRNNSNKFKNNVNWARNYLAYGGYIDRSIRGIWTLTDAGKNVDMTDELASELFKNYMAEIRNRRKTVGAALADDDVETTHFWLYAPGNEESKWDEFYEEGIMAIGWGEIVDLETYATKEEMRKKMIEIYKKNPL